jgi:hypothetical protein
LGGKRDRNYPALERNVVLVDASPNLAAIGIEADSASLKQVGHGGDSLTAVFAVAAHCENQVTEAYAGSAVGLFKILFHRAFGLLPIL